MLYKSLPHGLSFLPILSSLKPIVMEQIQVVPPSLSEATPPSPSVLWHLLNGIFTPPQLIHSADVAGPVPLQPVSICIISTMPEKCRLSGYNIKNKNTHTLERKYFVFKNVRHSEYDVSWLDSTIPTSCKAKWVQNSNSIQISCIPLLELFASICSQTLQLLPQRGTYGHEF